jgi:hypothetical protein
MKPASMWIRQCWQDLNPIVVKELRQAVRSWFVSGVLLLFLCVLLIYTLSFMASRAAVQAPSEGLGAEVFQVLIMILSGACLLFIPGYTGLRLALERQETNLDLLYITTLSPGRIVRGKMLCGIYLTLLFFSVCLPFIVLTNYMRGVDWITIGLTLLLLFFLVCLSVQLAIFLACLPVSLQFKAVVAMPYFGFMTSQVTLISSIALPTTHAGVFWEPRFLYLAGGIYVLAFIWLHLCAVALLSPRSMNRSLPLRSYSTLVWLLVGSVSSYYALTLGQGEILGVWIVFSVILITVGFIMSISQSDQLSLRVRKVIPSEPAVRVVCFPFFNGAAQGVAWCFLLVLLTAFGVYFAHGVDREWFGSAMSRHNPVSELLVWGTVAFVLYVCSYALTALFVHRTWLSAQRPAPWAGLIAFVIPALLALLPNLMLFIFNRLSWQVVEQRQLGNVFNVLLCNDVAFIKSHLGFAVAWVVIAGLANLPWFIQQVREFRPPEPAGLPPAL